MKDISRRDFLKVSGASMLAAAATAATAGLTLNAKAETVDPNEGEKVEIKNNFAPAVPGISGVMDRKNLPTKDWDDPDIKLKVRWSGVNFYEFVLPNGKTIIMDPYFDDPNDEHNEHKYTPTDLSGGKWVHGGEYCVLTHGHADHTGELHSVLEEYPECQVICPQGTLPSVVWREKINYAAHYISEAGAHDKFQFHGCTLETIRSNHNCSKKPKSDTLDVEKYSNPDGSPDFYKLYSWIYEREIMNMKLTTDDGFTVLLWNSEMQADGYGFETRPYFYQDCNPDLFMYQVAGASFDYDRRNPNCQHMGEWIASVKAKTALPEHQQHFSYSELDAMGDKFADICNQKGVGTSFLTPETGIWYGYTKDKDGNVGVYLLGKHD